MPVSSLVEELKPIQIEYGILCCKRFGVKYGDLQTKMPVKVVNYRTRLPEGAIVVNTTSHAAVDWQRDLSPFNLGPVELTLWKTLPVPRYAKNLENAWQFSKVYRSHLADDGSVSPRYYTWAQQGFEDDTPRRFPMGKGAKPEFSLYVDPETGEVEHLGYIEARKKIYVPLYAKHVIRTRGYAELKKLVNSTTQTVYLRDFDGYDAKDKTFFEILNDPTRKMGHAFVLAQLINEGV